VEVVPGIHPIQLPLVGQAVAVRAQVQVQILQAHQEHLAKVMQVAPDLPPIGPAGAGVEPGPRVQMLLVTQEALEALAPIAQ